MDISDGSLCVVEITFHSSTKDYYAGDYVKYNISSLNSSEEDLVSILDNLSCFVAHQNNLKAQKYVD